MKKITKQWFNRCIKRLESVFDIVMVLLKVFFLENTLKLFYF